MATIRVSREDGLGRLVLDHPPLNILTRAMLGEIREALAALCDDRTLRVLLLTATGKHFSAGADVGEHLPPDFRDLIPEFLETVSALSRFPVPTIAAVQGRCLGGGCELVLGADIILAADTARFGQPEIVLGVVPPAACALLPHRFGSQAAAQVVFTGDPLDATEAERIGLVRRIVSAAALEDEAVELAARMTRHSAAALRVAKRMLRAAVESREAAAMATAGVVYVDELMETADALEGLNAFLEKREPEWRHE